MPCSLRACCAAGLLAIEMALLAWKSSSLSTPSCGEVRQGQGLSTCRNGGGQCVRVALLIGEDDELVRPGEGHIRVLEVEVGRLCGGCDGCREATHHTEHTSQLHASRAAEHTSTHFPSRRLNRACAGGDTCRVRRGMASGGASPLPL